MGKDKLHTNRAKFKRGIISRADALLELKKWWIRCNFLTGEEKGNRNQIREKDQKKCLKKAMQDIEENGTY